MKQLIKKVTPEFILDAYRKLKGKTGDGSHSDSDNAMITEIASCPYCGSDKATTFRTVADIVKCSSCNLIYLRTRPTKETMYRIYQSYANSTSHLRLPSTIAEAKVHGLRREWFVNETLNYTARSEGNWLDIGCAWGALLNYTREAGFSPFGIELTRNCLDFASMRLQIPVSNSQFTDSEIGNSFCEVISMVHVLEHIPNPKETLAKIFNTLVPGGIFCGIVPNIESYCSEAQKEKWVWLDATHHYVHYAPATLKQKLEEAGFIVEHIYTSVGDGSDFFNEMLKREFPLKTEAELNKQRRELEKSGKGEEIRFFVRKPVEEGSHGLDQTETITGDLTQSRDPGRPELEKISCPYCRSKEAVTYSKIADIVKCSSCGLIYLRTRPTIEALYKIYQAYAHSTSHIRPPANAEDAKNHYLRREWFVNEVMNLSRAKNGTWLDIGCGWGALLMYAREQGFTPMGIEMTRNCLDFAASELMIPVSNNQFTDSVIKENTCQVISMVHVLEHIPNPPETLSKIFNTLVSGGIFCGIVPNIESYCSDLQKDEWVWLDATHHYVHYTPATLRQKLEEAGFIIERLYTGVGDYDEYFYDVLKVEFAHKTDAELEQVRHELEKNGKGDEIRFVARRP